VMVFSGSLWVAALGGVEVWLVGLWVAWVAWIALLGEGEVMMDEGGVRCSDG